ncbi:MAG TPA: LysM peptidoglycan-binding domain-containing protein [Vicinamibacteria bacterium]|nr:LysM peptidoglycan-binding domain-containing protein [Vicinamibacteria bacterium]
MQSAVAIVASIAAAGSPGCRSAAPSLSHVMAADPPAAAPPEVAGADAGIGAPPEAETPPGEAAPGEAAAGPEPGPELGSGGGAAVASGSDPEVLQKQALEMCQTAAALLERGEVEEAVAALDRAYEVMLALPVDGDDAFLQAREDIRLLVAGLIARAYRSGRTASGSSPTSWDLALPIVENEQVQREIRSLTTVEREQFLAGYRRSGRYRPMILAKLEAAGLPSQLSWLPLVESWFEVRALSRASALGLWQFISSTGLRYGLVRDAWIDERLDPEKSTDAAIAYLVDLHGLFGDWPKALAAYNCGEARVQRLQRRSSGEYQDFWDLYAELPRETRRYVPRLFAALQVIESPERYGIGLPEPQAPAGEVTRVEVERSVKLEHLDGVLGLERGTLAALNPELRYRATPRRPYALSVPAGEEPALRARIDSLPELKRPPVRYATHRVRRGESLSVIARRYRSSVSAIMRLNGIRSAHRIWPGQRLRIPVKGSLPVRRAAGDGPDRAPGARRVHRVASGETLGRIAEAHGVSLSALLRANGLSPRSTIYPGQSLAIPD